MNQDQTDDITLVSAAKAGDMSALDALLARHRPAILRLLRRMPLSDADRSDLLQEAQLQVLRKLDTFRGDSQFSTWMYRVAANAALMRLRSERRRSTQSLDALTNSEPDTLGHGLLWRTGESSQDSAEATLFAARRRAELVRALDALPEHHRELVLGHYVEGAALQSLAELHGTTESAVRSKLHRARAALRKSLASQEVNEGAQIFAEVA